MRFSGWNFGFPIGKSEKPTRICHFPTGKSEMLIGISYVPIGILKFRFTFVKFQSEFVVSDWKKQNSDPHLRFSNKKKGNSDRNLSFSGFRAKNLMR